MTVNRERVQLLVDALRSGNFEQGQNMLRTKDDTYCCLGVACEVARLNGIGLDWKAKETGCECQDCQDNRWHFDGSNEGLGEKVAAWYGFERNSHAVADPEIGNDESGNTVTTIRANDDYGWDFNRIADALESTYLEGDPK